MARPCGLRTVAQEFSSVVDLFYDLVAVRALRSSWMTALPASGSTRWSPRGASSCWPASRSGDQASQVAGVALKGDCVFLLAAQRWRHSHGGRVRGDLDRGCLPSAAHVLVSLLQHWDAAVAERCSWLPLATRECCFAAACRAPAGVMHNVSHLKVNS
jgi:hypothetical protein